MLYCIELHVFVALLIKTCLGLCFFIIICEKQNNIFWFRKWKKIKKNWKLFNSQVNSRANKRICVYLFMDYDHAIFFENKIMRSFSWMQSNYKLLLYNIDCCTITTFCWIKLYWEHAFSLWLWWGTKRWRANECDR